MGSVCYVPLLYGTLVKHEHQRYGHDWFVANTAFRHSLRRELKGTHRYKHYHDGEDSDTICSHTPHGLDLTQLRICTATPSSKALSLQAILLDVPSMPNVP